ncbi:MAG: biotin transporter BioY [Treponema sp.]|nr:biotin transporter BioY [Treponema sp.]MEE3435567.1 biotin transporter BioY [Treponema sp.]
MKSVKVQKKLTLSALFASLICAGCFIQIPLPGGVPIVIQDMMAMLSGLLLGPVFGGLAVLLFLLLGTVGLPVFTGKAGLHVLLAGPTSGFLWGYFFAAVIGGTILALFELTQKHAADKSGQNEASPEPQAKKSRSQNIARIAIITLAALAATITAFACGVAGGIIVMHLPLEKALPLYVLPFIPGNLIKLVLMVLLTKKFRPTILAYTN